MVFPKRGESFVIELDHFEIHEERFVLYARHNEIAEDRYLSFSDVAAVVPANQQQANTQFFVLLRNGRNLKIWANRFALDGQIVKFYVRSYDQQEKEITEVFVASREVISITPIYNEW